MRVRIELPYPLPLMNRLLAMNHWQRMKLRHLCHQSISSLRATENDMFDTDGPNAKAHIDGLVAIGLLPGDTAKVIRQITFRSEIAAEERTVIEIVDVS